MFNKMLITLLLLLAFPLVSQAHKVNFFAYVDGGEVICEGGFPGGKACRECPVVVKDAASDQELLRITSNNRGIARFPIDATIKAAQHGLKLVLWGGEGHQAEWLLDPEEYLNSSAPVPPAPETQSLQVTQKAQVANRTELAVTQREIDRMVAEEFEKRIGPLVDERLEAKLAPIRRQMAKAQNTGPSLVSILGGIGLIVGFAGLLAWFRSRQG